MHITFNLKKTCEMSSWFSQENSQINPDPGTEFMPGLGAIYSLEATVPLDAAARKMLPSASMNIRAWCSRHHCLGLQGML